MAKRSKSEKIKEKFNKKCKGSKSHNSSNPERTIKGDIPAKDTHYRSKSTIKLLNLYKKKPDMY